MISTTRRTFVKTLAAGLAATAVPLHASTRLNVGIGTYSYHNLSMEQMIVQLNALGVEEIEMSRQFMLMNHPTDDMFHARAGSIAQKFAAYRITATLKEDADETRRRFAQSLGSRNVTGDARATFTNRIDQRFTAEISPSDSQSLFQGEVRVRVRRTRSECDQAAFPKTVGAHGRRGHFASCGHDPWTRCANCLRG
jgi:hypothetical protein